MRSPVHQDSAIHLHLDVVGGIAGDMFIAAILNAFPELMEPTTAAIRAVLEPAHGVCRLLPHHDHTLSGQRFLIDHVPTRAQAHVPYAQIRDELSACDLSPAVKHHALAIFSLLGEAEAIVHGEPVEAVCFHELGRWDSVADIVGVAALINALPHATWSVSTLPLGRGYTQCAHGKLPVPSPVVSRLLTGYTLVDDGIEGERITPTGAAILRYLRATQAIDRAPRTLVTSGYGFGTKTFPDLSNVLRVLVFERAGAAAGSDQIALLTFDVDDQTPEDLAIALDRLRQIPMVLDVLQIPAFGKKGRMTAMIQIMSRIEGVEQVVQRCFAETSTLGIRTQLVERRVLSRRHETAQIGDQNVRVKIAARPHVETAKVESDDLRSLDGGLTAREYVRAEVVARLRDHNE